MKSEVKSSGEKNEEDREERESSESREENLLFLPNSVVRCARRIVTCTQVRTFFLPHQALRLTSTLSLWIVSLVLFPRETTNYEIPASGSSDI